MWFSLIFFSNTLTSWASSPSLPDSQFELFPSPPGALCLPGPFSFSVFFNYLLLPRGLPSSWLFEPSFSFFVILHIRQGVSFDRNPSKSLPLSFPVLFPFWVSPNIRARLETHAEVSVVFFPPPRVLLVPTLFSPTLFGNFPFFSTVSCSLSVERYVLTPSPATTLLPRYKPRFPPLLFPPSHFGRALFPFLFEVFFPANLTINSSSLPSPVVP